MRITVFQHVPFETPARIAHWARARGHDVDVIRTDRARALPGPDAVEALVVMGGPMGVGDGLDWIAREVEAVRRVLAMRRPVVGVCLGAQVMAAALGARVAPMPGREIGWFEVKRETPGDAPAWARVLPERFVPLHWHGDAFDLPAGAIRLASSPACANQLVAFAPHALGLQFHLEMDREAVEALIAASAEELAAGGPWVQSPAAIRDGIETRCHAAHQLLDSLLDAFFAACG